MEVISTQPILDLLATTGPQTIGELVVRGAPDREMVLKILERLQEEGAIKIDGPEGAVDELLERAGNDEEVLAVLKENTGLRDAEVELKEDEVLRYFRKH